LAGETLTEEIERAYAAAYGRSEQLFERQQKSIPGGITHIARVFDPFPLFVDRCVGSHKWDVDGHEFVDYWMGHGANLLGHGHPRVIAAVTEQLGKGFHAGGETEVGLRWAELVCELVPSAETVRFTSSGGEATQMAIRVARAVTGKDLVAKFTHNFHGWHDQVTAGIVPPYEVPYSDGVPAVAHAATVLLPNQDLEATQSLLEERDDVAAVILEPGGGFSDAIPNPPEFLRALRSLTQESGVLLIFDEVVTGFRYARGGAQDRFRVIPDLTALGKILGGGIGAGAVAGRRELMEPLVPGGDQERIRHRFIPHPGTWNANPLAAAAGVATLEVVRDEDPVSVAEAKADTLRSAINELFAQHTVPGIAYGGASILRVHIGEIPGVLVGNETDRERDFDQLLAGSGPVGDKFRKAMLLEGVDLIRTNGFVASAHTDADIERTIEAVDRALTRLKMERVV
jgi:glutamate-1-semialdehyde 2,1-aminomutase